MKNRDEIIQEATSAGGFDVVVVGGGASGIGAALEASLRGFKTLLLEKHDFTKGTSSKSTKLIHGGVRYLAQGDIKMVREALKERGYLVKNAPHLVHDQPFIIPAYKWWEGIFYTTGLTLYDILAGKYSLGRSKFLGREKVIRKLPGLSGKGLRGGILYHDGQFDDSRLAMDMLHEFFRNGGLALNYFEVYDILKNDGDRITGVRAKNVTNDQSFEFKAKTVINATGVWADDVMQMDDPGHKKMIRPSQGIHIVISKNFMKGDHALMIPKTSDGRVLFAVPWHDHLVVGTTDTPVDSIDDEPVPLEDEVRFILDTASGYLIKKVERSDVLSVFTGLRPLAAPTGDRTETREISRNHKVLVSKSKLITVVGGKWTTYRKMGQDMIDAAIKQKLLPQRASRTKNYKLSESTGIDVKDQFAIYGRNAMEIRKMIANNRELNASICEELPYSRAEIEWLCRNEMVVHLEDLMARRTRALLLNAKAAYNAAEKVARDIAPLLNWDKKKVEEEVLSFREMAKKYILN